MSITVRKLEKVKTTVEGGGGGSGVWKESKTNCL